MSHKKEKMINQPGSIDDLLGRNDARGKDFEGDHQRLSFQEAETQRTHLLNEFGRNEVITQEDSIFPEHGKLEITRFRLTPEQKETEMQRLMTDLRGLAGISLHGYHIGECNIEANFFSWSGGYWRGNEGNRPTYVSCEDDQVSYLAYVVSSLSWLVGMAEKSLPPNDLGYFPEDGTSMSNLDVRYVEGLNHLHDFIERDFTTKADPDVVKEVETIFDRVVDRIEKQRPAIQGRRISKTNLPYFANPPGEYFEPGYHQS